MAFALQVSLQVLMLESAYYSVIAQYPEDIVIYEFGEHANGEQLAYEYNKIIPHHSPHFLLNVTLDPVLYKKNYSYLTIAVPYSLLHYITLGFDPRKMVILIKSNTTLFKDHNVRVIVKGYAVPRRKGSIPKGSYNDENFNLEMARLQMEIISI